MRICPKLARSLPVFILFFSCAPQAPEETLAPPTSPEIVDFHIAQIQAAPPWELKAQRAQETQPQTFAVHQLHLRLDTARTPLELSSPLGQFQAPQLHLQGPVHIKHAPIQGTLAQANWSEEKGWSGTNAQISGPNFNLQGERITSSPPYRSLQLEQVKARFYP